MKLRKHIRRSNRSGVTLVEVLVAGSMLVLVAGSAVVASRLTQDAYREENLAAELDEAAELALDEVVERLRPADMTTVFPLAVTGTYTDWIDFQATTLPGAPASKAESIVLESDPDDPDDGVDNDGDGVVDERYLVWYENRNVAGEKRRVLAKWVAENLEGETPNNLIDDNGNGIDDEAGFALEFADSHVIVRLTLQKPDRNGNTLTRTVERTIAMRNTTP